MFHTIREYINGPIGLYVVSALLLIVVLQTMPACNGSQQAAENPTPKQPNGATTSERLADYPNNGVYLYRLKDGERCFVVKTNTGIAAHCDWRENPNETQK